MHRIIFGRLPAHDRFSGSVVPVEPPNEAYPWLASGGGPHTALQYTQDFPTFSSDHKMSVGVRQDFIPWRKKHVQPVFHGSPEIIPFRRRKCEHRVNTLGEGLHPIKNPMLSRRQFAYTDVTPLRDHYVCSNLSKTMHQEVYADSMPQAFRVGDLRSPDTRSFGSRIKNGCEISAGGKRRDHQDSRVEPTSMTEALIRDEEITTRRGPVPEPESSPRRDQDNPVVRIGQVLLRLPDVPLRRHWIQHPNYFPAPDAALSERRHIEPRDALSIFPQESALLETSFTLASTSTRRDQNNPVLRPGEGAPKRLPELYSRRPLRDHRNYFPAEGDVGLPERRHTMPQQWTPRAESNSIRLFPTHRNTADEVGRLLVDCN